MNTGCTTDCFFFNDTATTEIYTLSLHDALPISSSSNLLGASTRDGPVRAAFSRGCEDGFSSSDRKSTRLNSSHANISYAVFCLKKKKNINIYVSDSCQTCYHSLSLSPLISLLIT